eukprot:5244064-Amphidinium_carterae.1
MEDCSGARHGRAKWRNAGGGRHSSAEWRIAIRTPYPGGIKSLGPPYPSLAGDKDPFIPPKLTTKLIFDQIT